MILGLHKGSQKNDEGSYRKKQSLVKKERRREGAKEGDGEGKRGK